MLYGEVEIVELQQELFSAIMGSALLTMGPKFSFDSYSPEGYKNFREMVGNHLRLTKVNLKSYLGVFLSM